MITDFTISGLPEAAQNLQMCKMMVDTFFVAWQSNHSFCQKSILQISFTHKLHNAS